MTIRNFITTADMCEVVFYLYEAKNNRPVRCTLEQGLEWGDTEVYVHNVGTMRLLDGGTAWHMRPSELVTQVERFVEETEKEDWTWPIKVNLTTGKEWTNLLTSGTREWSSEDGQLVVQVDAHSVARLFDGTVTDVMVNVATVTGVSEGASVNMVINLLTDAMVASYQRKLR
jgi:hypothetical protein